MTAPASLSSHLERLDALEKLATEGPWVQDGRDVRAPDEKNVPRGYSATRYGAIDCESGADAAFIAAIRTAWPSISSQVRALIEERDALREALKAVHDWRGLCDADDLETFERIAELFRRDSGMLAPGKDKAAALGGSPTDEERRTAWNAWRTRKNLELNAQIRAALSRSMEKPRA